MICETMAGDNRFEIIAKAKHAILDSTNIETDEDEMKVLDNILFRCWQMGWLDKYDNQQNVDGDLISRKDAIRKCCGEKCGCEREDCGYTESCLEVSRLERLPSAPDSRQRGEWVWDEDAVDWGIGAWCCSECGSVPQTWWSVERNKNPLICAGSRFCGNCGADMRGEEE